MCNMYPGTVCAKLHKAWESSAGQSGPHIYFVTRETHIPESY